MDTSPLNQSIEQVLDRIKSSGVDIGPVKDQITDRLENKALEVFLTLMSPEQITQYKAAVDSNDPDTIEQVSSEIAVTMPQLADTLNQVMEVEYQQIVTDLSR